jgi:hypothetical protein
MCKSIDSIVKCVTASWRTTGYVDTNHSTFPNVSLLIIISFIHSFIHTLSLSLFLSFTHTHYTLFYCYFLHFASSSIRFSFSSTTMNIFKKKTSPKGSSLFSSSHCFLFFPISYHFFHIFI